MAEQVEVRMEGQMKDQIKTVPTDVGRAERTAGVEERSGGPSGDELRQRLRGMWATVAPRWEEHADYVDARGADVTRAMLAAVALRAGERVLELASGPGSVGLAAAAVVGPGGEVVISDAVPEMASIARARADALGLDNISARVLDLELIDEPDSSFDVVVCRDGLMFAHDPGRAAAEIHRVLRSGGRVALAVWGPRDRNPWLGVALDAVSAQVGFPVPPPGVPGPFSLADAERLARLFIDAGFEGVVVDELATPLRASSFDEWWTRTSQLAGPVAQMLASLPADAAAALRERARHATREYETAGGLELPGVNLLLTAGR
jgi:ubiquinone/menaquinone biosynthesis C-methylase UbiE